MFTSFSHSHLRHFFLRLSFSLRSRTTRVLLPFFLIFPSTFEDFAPSSFAHTVSRSSPSFPPSSSPTSSTSSRGGRRGRAFRVVRVFGSKRRRRRWKVVFPLCVLRRTTREVLFSFIHRRLRPFVLPHPLLFSQTHPFHHPFIHFLSQSKMDKRTGFLNEFSATTSLLFCGLQRFL